MTFNELMAFLSAFEKLGFTTVGQVDTALRCGLKLKGAKNENKN